MDGLFCYENGENPLGCYAKSYTLDKPVVPEFLLHRCTPENLSAALQPLLDETSEDRLNQIEAFKSLKDIMSIETGESKFGNSKPDTGFF